ncbi:MULTISPECIES: hypothetical protein [unclassified Streptomyces]|uniref:hypothetical protein n=1 Tax=unclassified Streptomyces TaxID=2593676 RepID=UPI003329771D
MPTGDPLVSDGAAAGGRAFSGFAVESPARLAAAGVGGAVARAPAGDDHGGDGVAVRLTGGVSRAMSLRLDGT